MSVVSPSLAEEVAAGAFNASACMNCGVCTAVCPMEVPGLPRELFRLVLLGQEAEVRAHQEAVFSCLLCRLCEENCPAGVHIAENMRALRHYFSRKVFRLSA